MKEVHLTDDRVVRDNRTHKGDELGSKNLIPQATYNQIKGQIIAKQPAEGNNIEAPGEKESARESL